MHPDLRSFLLVSQAYGQRGIGTHIWGAAGIMQACLHVVSPISLAEIPWREGRLRRAPKLQKQERLEAMLVVFLHTVCPALPVAQENIIICLQHSLLSYGIW